MTQTSLGTPALVAVTLSPRGGGIAAVSRLVARVLGESTGPACRTMELARGATFETGMLRRVGFGLQVAATQAAGRCDRLVFTHLGLADIQAFVPRAVRRPYAVFLHDVEAWGDLSSRRRRVLAGAAVRLANSRFTAGRVAAAHPDAGPILPCHLALPPEDLAVEPGPGDWDPGPLAVLVVGRLVASERYKGHDQLLEAWPSVVAAHPDARLVCVGEGDDRDRLARKAAALGVGRRVTFTGFVGAEALRRLYARAALLAMPSRREGFGLVYLEAMAAGLPCLGSTVDAAREIIVDGETGVLVDPDDRATLAAQLSALLGDAPRRRRMGERGRARLVAEFGYAAFAARLRTSLASGRLTHAVDAASVSG